MSNVEAFRSEALVRCGRIRVVVLSALIVVVGFVPSGCAPPPSPSERIRVQEETRQANQVRADLAFLDGAEVEGRQTASRGFTRTAAYLAQQMSAHGLQPVLAGEFRSQYAAAIHRVVNHGLASVESVDGDTTRLVWGEDYLLVDIKESVGVSESLQRPTAQGLIWHSELPSSELNWNASITVESRATTAPMHVIGMIPGADPIRRDSVVVWLAPADGSGMQNTASWTDGSDLAIPSAALLAASRRAAALQRTWASIPQTVMVAFVSGTRDECSGPEMLARHFPWDAELIARIVVADMASVDRTTSTDLTASTKRCNWERVFKKVTAPVTVLHAYQPFASPAEYGFGIFRPRSETQRPDALDVATTEALRLSREFLEWLP